jgi:cell division protein ZapA
VSSSYRIMVQGREIPVRTTASPDHVQQIEAMVNERLAAAGATMSLPDPQLILMLALLNMAEEIVSLRGKLQPEGDTVARLNSLVEALDASLAAGLR